MFLGRLRSSHWGIQTTISIKKKFVVETRYCVALGQIPESFYPEVAANETQREEWVRPLAIDQLAGDLTKPP
jgi:adenine-specific DNA-methyltransferase